MQMEKFTYKGAGKVLRIHRMNWRKLFWLRSQLSLPMRMIRLILRSVYWSRWQRYWIHLYFIWQENSQIRRMCERRPVVQRPWSMGRQQHWADTGYDYLLWLGFHEWLLRSPKWTGRPCGYRGEMWKRHCLYCRGHFQHIKSQPLTTAAGT